MAGAGEGVSTIRTPEDARHLGTVLGLWAHPDDEADLPGALMALARRAGNRVVCLTAAAVPP
jgi:LmbE family N-acetylglucosaminyl deacetylase